MRSDRHGPGISFRTKQIINTYPDLFKPSLNLQIRATVEVSDEALPLDRQLSKSFMTLTPALPCLAYFITVLH
jgi:hypothetical protein